MLLWISLAIATTPHTYLGREIAPTMHASGAEWLTRDSRAVEEGSDILMASLPLEKGQVACDIGAGNGYYSLKLARKVGRKGRVLATDIQPAMLARLAARSAAAKVPNIERILSTETDAALPASTCDLIILVDVYHEFSDPKAMLEGLSAALTPTGVIALVEYRAEDDAVPIKPLHKMTVAQCDKEFKANGLTRVGRVDTLPWQHILFYERAAADGTTPAPKPN